MKKYRFYFHYNKPQSKAEKCTIWSVHFRGTCYMTKEIVCEAPCYSKTNKRQPFAVMEGFTDRIQICGDTLIIKNGKN